MKIPTLEGLIGRRLLVNFRVSPEVMTRLLPSPFRCKLVNGCAIAGICLIRLESIRPRGFPSMLGLSSENAAHRVAVEWDEGGAVRQGVYIPRRDTSSHINAWAGGTLFPGEQHLARFSSVEDESGISVSMESQDNTVSVAVRGLCTDEWPMDSVFASFAEVNDFFRLGSLGYSATHDPHRFQGMQLECPAWRAEPFHVESVHSSFFEDTSLFPPGSAVYDCALLMRDVPHEWHGCAEICGHQSPSPLP